MTPLLWLLLACPRQAPNEQVAYQRDPDGAISVPGGMRVDPGVWSDGQGLELVVPQGWAGEAGQPEAALRLTLEHAATGTRLLVWSFARSGPIGPRPREGCRLVFEDADAYRTVPALTPSGVYTCVIDRGAGDTVMTWYGALGDREVHLESFLRPGASIRGRRALDEIFATLTRGSRDGLRTEDP